MSEIRTNVTISGETLEYRSNIEISIVTLNSKLEDTHSSFRTNIDISTELNDGTISSIKTTLELDNISLDFYLVDMTKLNQSLLYFSKFFNMYFEPEVMWELLAQGTNEQINISHLSDALSNYVTFNNLLVINESLSNVSKILTEHINNNNRHLSEKERGFLEKLMNDPSYGSEDSLFELIELKVGEDLYSWAVKPFEYKGNKVGIVSNSYISCLGLDTTVSSYGITRSDLFAILSGEPLDDSEYIDERFIKAKDVLATKEWVYAQLTGISGGDIPPWVRDITLQQIQSWDLVASLFKLSYDDTYIYTTNNRGFVSHSFISCKGVDSSANQNSGITRSELFDILSNTPIDNSEYINLSFLDLSNYITKDEIVEYKGISIDEADSRYASLTAFNILNTKVITFLESENLNDTIDRWKEVEDFLLGYTEQQTLANILATKADLSLVNQAIERLTTVEDKVKTLSEILCVDADGDVYIGGVNKNNQKRNFYVYGGLSFGGKGTSGSGGSGATALSGLSDVALNALSNGQSLVYENGYWINKEVGLDSTAVWNTLATVDATKVIDSSHIPDLSGKYLNTSGGTITSSNVGLVMNRPNDNPKIGFQKGNNILGFIGFNSNSEPIVQKGVSVENTLIHSGNIGSQSVANADTLDSLHSIDFVRSLGDVGANTYKGNALGYTYSTEAHGGAYPGGFISFGNGVWGCQINGSFSGDGLAYRGLDNGVFSSWKTIAFLTSNVASATKLQDNTAYTAWGQPFFQNGAPQNVGGELSDVTRLLLREGDGSGIYRGNNYSFSYAKTDMVYHATIHRFFGGNVLIGTTADNGAKLQVEGAVSVRGSNSDVGGYAYYWGIDRQYYLGSNSDSDYYLWAKTASHLRIGTNDTERVRITSDGNVLIGTPIYSGYKLDVRGPVYTLNQLVGENLNVAKKMAVGKDVGDYMIEVAGGVRTGGSSYLYGYGASNATNLSSLSGYVGIGAGSSNWGIYLWSYGNGNGVIQVSSANDATRYDMLLQPFGGNVGIGTTNPQYKLDVNGGSLRLCAAIKSVNDTIAGFYTYPTNPYGLQIRVDTGTGDTYLQARREGKSEFFNLILQPDGGNVGINTPNPQYKLDVNGTLNAGDTTLTKLTITPNGIYTALTVNGDIDCGTIWATSVGTVGSKVNNVFASNITMDGTLKVGDVRITYEYNNGGIYLNINENLVVNKAITFGSDERYKTKLNDTSVSLETIADAPLFNYKWNDGSDSREHLGTTAQYWNGTAFKNAVIPTNSEKKWTMSYSEIAMGNTIVLARELLQTKQNHETRLERLERENKELNNKVVKLENELNQYRRAEYGSNN